MNFCMYTWIVGSIERFSHKSSPFCTRRCNIPCCTAVHHGRLKLVKWQCIMMFSCFSLSSNCVDQKLIVHFRTSRQPRGLARPRPTWRSTNATGTLLSWANGMGRALKPGPKLAALDSTHGLTGWCFELFLGQKNSWKLPPKVGCFGKRRLTLFGASCFRKHFRADLFNPVSYPVSSVSMQTSQTLINIQASASQNTEQATPVHKLQRMNLKTSCLWHRKDPLASSHSSSRATPLVGWIEDSFVTKGYQLPIGLFPGPCVWWSINIHVGSCDIVAYSCFAFNIGIYMHLSFRWLYLLKWIFSL